MSLIRAIVVETPQLTLAADEQFFVGNATRISLFGERAKRGQTLVHLPVLHLPVLHLLILDFKAAEPTGSQVIDSGQQRAGNQADHSVDERQDD